MGATLLVLIVALVFFNLQPGNTGQIQLTVWGFEKSDAVGGLTGAYGQLRPNVEIFYKQVSENSYENMLLSAIASGQGPDVFPVHNRGLAKNLAVLSPVASSQFAQSRLDALFPAEVGQDFAFAAAASAAGGATEKQVYALPLYFDTLSLIYNKDLFDQGGVANTPATWEEFQSDIAKLRNFSASGQIVRAAAAIGGSQKTVTNAVALLNALMLQNGVTMISGKYASFASEQGIGAFNFYLQFANPASNYYTWNESQAKDFDSFAAGNTAIVFGYNSDVQKIKSKSPFLRFGVAPLPQVNPANAVNYADYWGLAVSKQSKNPTWAWDFIINMATQPQIAGQYSDITGQPPALRELISQKINDPALGVFARQALTARSWNQPDETRVDGIFNDAIVSAIVSQSNTREILSRAQSQITQLMNWQ